MKALSIKQPWASLIAHGIKDIENRTWKTNFRGRIYINASAKIDKNFHKILSEEQRNVLRDTKEPYDITHLSAIIGEVDIVDCVINHSSIWAEKTPFAQSGNQRFYPDKPIYNWVLANPVLYDKPILNVKGKLSFWEIDKNEIIKNAYGRFYNPQLHHYSVSGWTDPNHYSDDEFYEIMQEIAMEFGEHRCRPKSLSNIFKVDL
ncbi:ASCH domain-containing protein [Flavobacterium sp.]|uniref:ASCH domain-containing protein n=1 Tax=Flavobacterium sp. TaxID=239 RepID=UPI00262D4BBD|nr:ASCH domain-containing protein [Flavobacterium sp.]